MSSRFSLRFLNPEISLLKKSLEGLTFVFRNFCCSQMASRFVGPPKIFYYFIALWKMYKSVVTNFFYKNSTLFLSTCHTNILSILIMKTKSIEFLNTSNVGSQWDYEKKARVRRCCWLEVAVVRLKEFLFACLPCL